MASHSPVAPVSSSDSGALFAIRPGEITQAPTRVQSLVCAAFRGLSFLFACSVIVLVTFIVFRITASALPAFRHEGLSFLTGRVWDSNAGQYGIAGEIWGTLYTSILALVIGTAFGLAAAIFLSEGYMGQAIFALLRRFDLHLHPIWSKVPDKIEDLLKQLIELLAAIPSVVYGLGWLPLFSTDLSGPGVLPAVLVLAIMILPTITAISRDALTSVPPKLRMAAYGLGATRWEAIIGVILPTAARGIFGGMVLAFGRALGETMALAMLVGNSNQISVSLFSPANTLAALLANNFPEAGPKEVGILMYAALVLLSITLVVNILGALILQRASRSAVE
jgi:phosphate transport system permease protein